MAYYVRLSYDQNRRWQLPGGMFGKSTNPNTHEHRFGFGFEEWFFNPRRFKDEQGNTNGHFAYVQAFCRTHAPDESEDLILYTLESNGRRVTNRYIVARIKAGSWRFIDHKRYQRLRNINNTGIAEMRDELEAVFRQGIMREGLIWNDVQRRFKQQVNCQDWYGQASTVYRLWNIELLKPVKLLMQPVDVHTPCPDSHISKLRMFNLYNSENFNHKKCK